MSVLVAVCGLAAAAGKQLTIKTIKLNLILWLSALTHGPAEVGVCCAAVDDSGITQIKHFSSQTSSTRNVGERGWGRLELYNGLFNLHNSNM